MDCGDNCFGCGLPEAGAENCDQRCDGYGDDGGDDGGDYAGTVGGCRTDWLEDDYCDEDDGGCPAGTDVIDCSSTCYTGECTCYTGDGSDYSGTASTTTSGLTCQRMPFFSLVHSATRLATVLSKHLQELPA